MYSDRPLLLFVICFLSLTNLICMFGWYFALTSKKKRIKCPNGYNCGDCIHADAHWEGAKFRGFSCRLDR